MICQGIRKVQAVSCRCRCDDSDYVIINVGFGGDKWRSQKVSRKGVSVSISLLTGVHHCLKGLML